jgi:hypothetical protein
MGHQKISNFGRMWFVFGFGQDLLHWLRLGVSMLIRLDLGG